MNVFAADGRIGKLSELKESSKGTKFFQMNLANDIYSKGEKHTNWVKCVMFGKRAASVHPMLEKGQKVFVTGELKIGVFEDKDGVSHPAVDLFIGDISFVPSGAPKQESSAPVPDDDDIPF